MDLKIVTTADGSSSVFVPDLDEHYHSIHGAIQESMHVFIHAGLKPLMNQKNKISVLEVGLGTGLNALLTCFEANDTNIEIEYCAIEKFPLQADLVNQLNYCNQLDSKNCTILLQAIHACSWNEYVPISQSFCLKKCQADITNVQFSQPFDVIYFDAFAPSAQPELWTEIVFKTMYDALKPGGILVTYCAKGSVKRTMKQVGFELEALPGPNRKREMTRARKI